MPNYPAQIDNSNSLPQAKDNFTPVSANVFNPLRSAVLAIESVLGINPNGLYTTVANRLDTLESTLGNTPFIEIDQDLGGTPESPLVIGIQGRPVADSGPAQGQVLAWDGIAWVPTTGFQSGAITLNSGSFTLNTGILINSTSTTKIFTQLVTVTVSGPGSPIADQYKVASLVAGPAGTGSFTVTAVNTSGTTVTSDNSTLSYLIMG